MTLASKMSGLISRVIAVTHRRMSKISIPVLTRTPLPLGIILLALTPTIMILLPWDFGTDSTKFRTIMRSNLLTTTVVEFAFVLLAMSRGFSPVAAILNLPTTMKIALLTIVAVTTWTTFFVAVFPLMAIIGVFKFVAHFFFGLAIAQQVRSWNRSERDLIWPAIGLGVVGFCVLWGVNIVLYNPVGNDWARLVPTLTNVRWAGLYSLAIFCAGIGLIHLRPDHYENRRRLATAILFASIAITLGFWTGTRAALFAICVTVALCLLILPVKRQIFLLTIISLVVGLGVAMTLPIPHPYYGFGRMVNAVGPAMDGEDISSGRMYIWIEMIDKIALRPVLGWGIDQFRYSFPEGIDAIRHPHNGVMQLIYSSGIVGVLAFLAMAAEFVRKLPRKFTEPYQFASIAFVIGACAYGLFDGLFYFTYPIMILLVAIACLIAPSPPSPASDRSD